MAGNTRATSPRGRTPSTIAGQKFGNTGRRRPADTRTGGNGAQAVNGRLAPDREQLKTFIEALFRHAGTEGYASLRSWYEDDADRSFGIKTVHLRKGLGAVINDAADAAREAANESERIVFSPPVAVFDSPSGWRAREVDLLLGLALSVECDQHAQEAREKLEQLLGPATVVVASGGEWVDPETGEVWPKLHLHWRLSKPAEGKRNSELKIARVLATELVGGDASNKPVVHCIRWPGSWHRKKEPKLCQIASINAESEIDLDHALEVLQKASPSTGNGKTQSGKTETKSDKEWWEWEGTNWGELIGNVLSGEHYHDSLLRLAAKLIVGGLDAGAAVNLLHGWMEAAVPPEQRDARWKARDKDIERSVSTAVEKFGPEAEARKKTAQETKAQGEADGIDPVDLWKNREAPPLPKGLLPKVIEDYAFAQGRLMGVDPAGVAMGALTVCAAVIPDSVQVQVKTHGRRWRESVRVWTALGGLVSAKKSPIMRTVTAPINTIEAELGRQYAAAIARYEESEDKKTEEKPKRRRLRIADVTTEWVQNVMLENPDGVMLVRDELSGWFGSMDKYTGGKGDRSFWLETFNGDPYSFGRVGRGSGDIENLSMNLLGGIQEDNLRKVSAESVDDGLIQRLFVIMLRPAVLGVDEPLEDDSYDNLVDRLYHKPREHSSDAVVEFSDEAQVIRRQLEQKHIDLPQAFERVNKKLAGHIGKYDGMYARLCLLWHCIETADAKWPSNIDIDAKTAQRVADFLHGFLLKHAVAFYIGMMGLSDDHDRLVAVAGYILTHGLEYITPRDIQRGDRSMRRLERRDTDRIFEQLEAYGWITKEKGKRFSDVQWRVNQRVHGKFAAKAKEETERRRADRALIIASLPGHADEE